MALHLHEHPQCRYTDRLCVHADMCGCEWVGVGAGGCDDASDVLAWVRAWVSVCVHAVLYSSVRWAWASHAACSEYCGISAPPFPSQHVVRLHCRCFNIFTSDLAVRLVHVASPVTVHVEHMDVDFTEGDTVQ